MQIIVSELSPIVILLCFKVKLPVHHSNGKLILYRIISSALVHINNTKCKNII